MSTRLQVVMSDEELDEVRSAAERHRLSVSEWVRTVLRAERDRERRGGSARVREAGAPYGGPPRQGRRLTLELDLKEDLIDAVQARFRLASRRAAVEFALRRVAVEPMTREEALSMEGVGWDGDLDELRRESPPAGV